MIEGESFRCVCDRSAPASVASGRGGAAGQGHRVRDGCAKLSPQVRNDGVSSGMPTARRCWSGLSEASAQP